ncbi:hypothetical protein WA158_008077 [Blastocystis sp. Blastoise]
MDNEQLYAITPITHCMHDAKCVVPNCYYKLKSIFSTKNNCHCCKCYKTENLWICCGCLQLFCGRDQNRHMIIHAQLTDHTICCSVEDLSFWCFGETDDCVGCDYYIDEFTNPHINEIYRYLIDIRESLENETKE